MEEMEIPEVPHEALTLEPEIMPEDGVVAENESNDETDIGSDEEKGINLGCGYESDRSADEPATAEDMEFLDDEEDKNMPSTSHAALLQNARNEDENEFFSRFVLFHTFEITFSIRDGFLILMKIYS